MKAPDTLQTLTLSDFGLDPSSRKARLRRIGDVILAEWSAEASKQLNGTLSAYKQALSVEVIGDSRVRVSLPGEEVEDKSAQIARIVEFGMGPGGIGTQGQYDVRRFLLQQGTQNLKLDKHGKPYVNVPFGHTLKSISEMAAAGNTRAAANAASGLAGTTSSTNDSGKSWSTLWGGRMAKNWAPKLAEHHSVDPLQGMVRMRSTYSKGKRGKIAKQTSGFRTWRRASWNADPRKWMSKGVKARRIGDQIAAKVPALVMEVL